jgi:pyruvate,water dikinase
MGVMTRDEMARPITHISDAMATVYYGRVAVNVDWLRRMMDRTPGNDADTFEASMLGSVRPGVKATPTKSRYLAVVARSPMWMRGLRSKAVASSVASSNEWRDACQPRSTPSVERAAAELAHAFQRFWDAQLVHGPVLNVGQILYGQIAALCAKAGQPGLELELAGRGGGTEELEIVADLRAAAAGRLSLDEVVARHGYHGPDEGDIAARVWREDPTPLAALMERYETGDAASDRVDHERVTAAERGLLLALPRSKRATARFLLRRAETFVPLREVTKSAFLRQLDVARIRARALGHALVAVGSLDDVDDVFLLTLREATTAPLRIDRDVLDDRRQRRAEYRCFDIPLTFVGSPQPLAPTTEQASEGDILAGVAASPGRADGVARIIVDPDDAGSLEPGEILVCHTTDPSWVPYLQIAGAVVVDIGGPLSHAAIVARELGVPAVVNCIDATGRIRSGAKVRVDGSRGEVHILAN